MKLAILVLACGSYQITVENKAVTLAYDGFTLHLSKSADSDCLGRSHCYQDGQFMVNLHLHDSLHGIRSHAHVNTDVDDIPGLGERVACREVK